MKNSSRLPTPIRRWHQLIVVGSAALLPLLLLWSSAMAQGPSPQTFSLNLTFRQMNKQHETLNPPLDEYSVSFGLPPDIAPAAGSYLTLDLEYVVANPALSYAPARVGVLFNNKLLETVVLQAATVNTVRLPIPPDLIRTFDDPSLNYITLSFASQLTCSESLATSLVVLDSSAVHIAYSRAPLPLDLNLYPKPIYLPRSQEPASARIVLPAVPAEIHAQSAAMIAAYLGAAGEGKVILTSTLGIDLLVMRAIANDHFILIGTPEELPILRQLDLPVALAERRHEIWGVTPTELGPGQPYDYSLTVKNSAAAGRSLQLVDELPLELSLAACEADCRQEGRLIRWDLGVVGPGQSRTVTATLVLQDAGFTPGRTVDHTATLLEENKPVNVKTLSGRTAPQTSVPVVSPALVGSTYFFVSKGQAVPEQDGLLQEIYAPGSPRKVAIIVTGLTPEGLLKAARALSTQKLLPGIIRGDHAFIQSIHPITTALFAKPKGFTLAALGYPHQVIRGTENSQLYYAFHLPWGAKLLTNNYIFLHFTSSAALSSANGTATISLNNLPIGSINLADAPSTVSPISSEVVARMSGITSTATADGGWLSIVMPEAAVWPGENLLVISMKTNTNDPCGLEQNWLTIYNDSFIHTSYAPGNLDLRLSSYPQPFTEHPSLANLAILMPDAPTPSDYQALVSLTAALGRAAGGDTFWPKVARSRAANLAEWQDYHLIAFGQPTQNSVIAQVNQDLPQRFVPGTDQIEQVVNTIIYRLPPDLSLGLLQEMLSPHSTQRAFLAATGTTDEGVAWTLAAMSNTETPWWLAPGNLAVIKETQLTGIDTRESDSYQVRDQLAEIVPELTPVATQVVTPTPAATSEPTDTPSPQLALPTPSADEQAALNAIQTRPRWLFPALGGGAVLILITLILIIWQSRS